MGTFSELFESILENPVLVIGEKSATKLFFYMYGSTKASKMYGEEDLFYDDFSKWVAEHTRMSRSHNWANITLYLSFGCEYEAFDLAKKLWFEYKSENQKMDTVDFPSSAQS
jgi:hypothetical protein